MYKFFLGLIAGAALCHFAEERKKKKAVDDIKAAGAAVGEAAKSTAEAVKSTAEKPATETTAS